MYLAALVLAHQGGFSFYADGSAHWASIFYIRTDKIHVMLISMFPLYNRKPASRAFYCQ